MNNRAILNKLVEAEEHLGLAWARTKKLVEHMIKHNDEEHDGWADRSKAYWGDPDLRVAIAEASHGLAALAPIISMEA